VQGRSGAPEIRERLARLASIIDTPVVQAHNKRRVSDNHPRALRLKFCSSAKESDRLLPVLEGHGSRFRSAPSDASHQLARRVVAEVWFALTGNSIGRTDEHGPSRNQAKSLTSGSPEFAIIRGRILTQIVRQTACPFVINDARIGSCFVSPSQYGLALYQRCTTLGTTVVTKTPVPSFTHSAHSARLSNWFAISIRSKVMVGSESVKRKCRGALVLSCATTIIDIRPAGTGSIPCSAGAGTPLASGLALINAIARTTTQITLIAKASSSPSAGTWSMLT
jgi:hypothetical protein